MSDELNQGGLESLLGGSGSAGGTNSPPAAGGGDKEPEAPAWTSQLSKEIRENVENFSKVRGFKSISDLASAYITKPEAEFDTSDPKSVFEKMGAPKDGETYEFEKDLKGVSTRFVEIARGAMLTQEQAAKTLEGFQMMEQARIEQNIEETKKAAKGISEALVKEFGEDATKYYRKAVEGNKLNTLLAQSGLGANKELARALTLLGEAMSEDYTPHGETAAGESYASWRDGARFTRT